MGQDYIIHHGVKGQHKGHRRWQNPDGSYTDAGFIHYYGHPRIRNRKEKDGIGINAETARRLSDADFDGEVLNKLETPAYGDSKHPYQTIRNRKEDGKKGVFSKLAMQVGENMKKSMEFRKDPENQKKYGQGIIPGLINLYKDSKQKKAEQKKAEEARQKAYTEKRQKLRDRLDDAEDKKWRKMLSLMEKDPDIKDVYKKVLKTEWGEGLKETGKKASDGSYYFSPYDAYASFWSYAMEDASIHDDTYYKAVYKAFDLEENDPTVKRLREKEESLWNELEALDAQHKGGKK